MREILFRGRRIDDGEWVYGSFLRDGEAHRLLERPELPFSDCYIVPKTERDNVRAYLTKGIALNVRAHHVLPESIGQYTGLKDKNGQRIFEGDIVKCKHFYDNFDETFDSCKIRRAYGKAVDESNGECTYWRNYEVRMGDGRWVLRNGSDGHDMKQNYVQNHLVEVIGNIHDNQELLKEA